MAGAPPSQPSRSSRESHKKKRFDLVGFSRIYLDFREFIGVFEAFSFAGPSSRSSRDSPQWSPGADHRLVSIIDRHAGHAGCAQSQRDCVLQPRVARHALPWVTVSNFSPTPTGLRHSWCRSSTGADHRHDGPNYIAAEQRETLERFKKYCSHSGRGFLVFGRGFGEGAGLKDPVTEPKRSQNPKRPPLYFFPTEWLQYFLNRSSPW